MLGMEAAEVSDTDDDTSVFASKATSNPGSPVLSSQDAKADELAANLLRL